MVLSLLQFSLGQEVPEEMYNRFMSKNYGSKTLDSDLIQLVKNRILDMFLPWSVDSDALCIDAAVTIIKALRAHDAIRVFKTWVNGWTMSTRMHDDPVLPCLFGCHPAEDRQSHYCTCPNLFGLVRFLHPLTPPP